ncbi:sensor histidine kinase [Aetokthonos hydrillicola Thurmond2011]|jgi:signal transduction histidine kinase|uniref:Oxygen sensor histidine kinase NreB n=3 Tax=Aetokthonos TaxID=1550243 RepID=A0AAP5I650_9CYAN|nr:sensor histidine kinase [Aetokthonos hydrillicola CCALA 1050]MDR9895717.1 sensor histidine kinase [Aetokthonos hydrillicola Thurmond2011]
MPHAPLLPLNPMLRPTSQSFRLLLYLEWLLLVTAAFMEVFFPFELSWDLLLQILAITAFGLMGLKLPTSNLGAKLFYTAIEFGLMLLPATKFDLSSRSVFLMCLVLVMRSSLIFPRAGQFTVLSLAFLCHGTILLSKPIGKYRVAVWDWRLSSLLLFSLTLLFALLLINALHAERQSREQLQKVYQELEITHDQLRNYALRIQDQATLQERNRIAREIHDGLGHTLAAQTIQINNALLFWQSNNDKALTFLKQAKQLGSEALLEIRRSVSVLRSNPLQGQTLESAIDKLLKDFQNTTGIKLESKIHLPLSLSTEANTTLYRIIQESLTNIYKHAHATTVIVELVPQVGMLELSIVDNGEGFNPIENTTGFGLQGMRERAAALGGKFQLHSQPGKGCRISVSFPISNVVL